MRLDELQRATCDGLYRSGIIGQVLRHLRTKPDEDLVGELALKLCELQAADAPRGLCFVALCNRALDYRRAELAARDALPRVPCRMETLLDRRADAAPSSLVDDLEAAAIARAARVGKLNGSGTRKSRAVRAERLRRLRKQHAPA